MNIHTDRATRIEASGFVVLENVQIQWFSSFFSIPITNDCFCFDVRKITEPLSGLYYLFWSQYCTVAVYSFCCDFICFQSIALPFCHYYHTIANSVLGVTKNLKFEKMLSRHSRKAKIRRSPTYVYVRLVKMLFPKLPWEYCFFVKLHSFFIRTSKILLFWSSAVL